MNTDDMNMHGDIPIPTASNIAELSKPIKKVEEKWKLLPYFLRLRGLMRQVFIIHYTYNYSLLIILLIAY